MNFVRYGLFGSCEQKGYIEGGPLEYQGPKYHIVKFNTWFHSPPTPWGMYAMPEGFEERGLLGSSIELQGLNCSWQEFLSMRTVFSWDGLLWHHLGKWCKEEDVFAKNRSWVKTSVDVFETALIHSVLEEEERRRRNGEVVIHFLYNDPREVFIEYPIARQQ
jgi:hypothetical protein